MKFKITLLVSVIFILFNSLLFAQKKHEIRFASIAPSGTTPDKIIVELNDEIKKLSGGRLSIKIYPGTQGDESDIVKKMNPAFGRLDAAGLTGRGLGEILPMIRVMELPFLFENYDEVDYVAGKLYDRFSDEFSKKGIVLLGWAEVGFVYIFSKDKIATLQDLKKTKMWTWAGDPLARVMFQELDVTPRPLALPDALTSLQTGHINAVYAHPYGTVALQWHERTNYMNALPVTFGTGAVIITQKKFNELEPDLQDILRTSSKKKLEELVKQTRLDNEIALNFLQDQGVEIIPKPEGDNLRVFLDAGKNVRERLAGELYPQELLDQVLAILKEYRGK